MRKNINIKRLIKYVLFSKHGYAYNGFIDIGDISISPDFSFENNLWGARNENGELIVPYKYKSYKDIENLKEEDIENG